MRFPGLDLDMDTVVVLGAGATRGAQFVQASALLKPPTDRDFFQQLQRVRTDDHQKIGDKMIKALDRHFRWPTEPTMEEFFTQIEFLARLESRLHVDPGRISREYEELLVLFKRAMIAVFSESIGNNKCTYHEALVRHMKPKDAILSFNYDCVADSALREAAGGRWDPRTGYCLEITGNVDPWTPQAVRGRRAKHSIKLLKLHGSLNWKRTGDKTGTIRLLRDPYPNVAKSEDIEIIPPQWHKPVLDDPAFVRIWKAARSALRNATSLVFIGYSLPATDVHAQALFRVDTKQWTQFGLIVIVNPDAIARQRILETLREAIGEDTRVYHFETLRDFVRQVGLLKRLEK